ncbi:MAG: ABC transporter [Actinomycetales bacterium]|nr:MAG: ABC transporter [Actinomycetales bacterium]
MMRRFARDRSVLQAELAPGTSRRVLAYARPYTRWIVVFLALVVMEAMIVVAVPLLLREIVDAGVVPGDSAVVIGLAFVVAGLAVLDAVVGVARRWYSTRIGESLTFDLRTQVFGHVLRQPVAFFTRAQTGSLVSRLNSDIIGAQQALTTVLSSFVNSFVSLMLIIGAMLALSWQLTIGALLLVPVFLVLAKVTGRRLAVLTATQMAANAELQSRMTERFNVAGALLVKLFGTPDREQSEYAERAGVVRDTAMKIAMNRAIFITALALVAALATAMVYGFGGLMALDGTLTIGTLLALAALLARLYGPLTSLSNVRIDVMTALVSFDRVFEVLDLQPLVAEADHPVHVPDGPVQIDFEAVGFAYPSADEVSLRSLEATTSGDRAGGAEVLRDVTFTAHPGQLVALVGPSGAGKTTVTALVARLYDPTSGVVRIGGVDLREASLDSLHSVVGMVTQEAHLFHDTIRGNLAYAKPDASEGEMRQALAAAQVLTLVEALPAGLDTVVGDRGHRLSGGEKQRLAIARLLLKEPQVVVLDEATAHLDSESEVAVQRALDAALDGRTAVVIAHRLSTVRGADQILVVDGGRIVDRGRHAELLGRGGLYADLYRTQYFEDQAAGEPPD